MLHAEATELPAPNLRAREVGAPCEPRVRLWHSPAQQPPESKRLRWLFLTKRLKLTNSRFWNTRPGRSCRVANDVLLGIISLV